MDDPRDAPVFPETADIETSSDEYATRFAGPAGGWMLDVQLRRTRDLMRDLEGASILDVGGGHGQLAVPLCARGHAVTVLGSDESCRHRIRSVVDVGGCTFAVGNVVDLPFEDDSFDVAMSFRLLTHCGRWPVLVRELCRVARRAVIVDYPTSTSVNAVAPLLFGAKKRVERNTRTWRLFRHAEVRAAFREAGWRLDAQRKQFFFPMVLHRMLKSPRVSGALEGTSRGLGLTCLLGSPVIVRMVPEAR